jgi:transposase-like protein
MILSLVEEAVAAGARLAKAAAVIGVSARTLIRWRQKGGCTNNCVTGYQ